MDDIKKIANSRCCFVHTDNFLYVTIFICHIKKRQCFSNYNFNTKICQFCTIFYFAFVLDRADSGKFYNKPLHSER